MLLPWHRVDVALQQRTGRKQRSNKALCHPKGSSCTSSKYSEGKSLSGNIRAGHEPHSRDRETDSSPLAAGWIKDLMQGVPLEKITQAIKKNAPFIC